jgi:hypothetical protein
MKSGKDLQALAAEIVRRQNAKKDFIVRTNDIGMTDTGALRFGDNAMPVGSIAHGQIAEHADIPKKYYDRMLAEDPRLLANNVNAWFAKYPVQNQRMVRTLDGQARAMLSDKFEREYDNEHLASLLLPIIGDAGYEVMSSEITERRLYLKVVDSKVVRELKAIGGKFGDGAHNIVRMLSPAVTVSNSEVGFGALSIFGGVYDGFCSNLATFGERSVRKYHTGARHALVSENVVHLLTAETKSKTAQANLLQARDVFKAALDTAQFDSLCKTISETQGQKIEGDIVKCVELAATKLELSEVEGSDVLKHLVNGGDLSRFGLYNAITRMSQDVEDYDRATELERIGAKVIELPKHDWQELAKAA